MDLITILMWIFAALAAIFAIGFVWLIMSVFIPARSTMARYFIEAKKTHGSVALVDTGSRFIGFVCEQTHPRYWNTKAKNIDQSRFIKVTPDSIRDTLGNVPTAIAEHESLRTIGTATAEVINALINKGIEPNEVKEVLKLIDLIRKDANEKDIKELQKKIEEMHKNVRKSEER